VRACSLVVFGGFNGTQILADMFTFNVRTFEWALVQLRSPLPLPAMYGHSMNAVPNSTSVVIFGGCLSASQLSARTYWVNLSSNTAVQALVQDPPPSRFWHGSFATSTKLYIFGGSGSENNALTDVAALDFFDRRPVNPSLMSARPSWLPLCGVSCLSHDVLCRLTPLVCTLRQYQAL